MSIQWRSEKKSKADIKHARIAATIVTDLALGTQCLHERRDLIIPEALLVLEGCGKKWEVLSSGIWFSNATGRQSDATAELKARGVLDGGDGQGHVE